MAARPYTVFMLLQATPHWLSLDREAREAVRDSALMQVYNRFPSVRLRSFESGAFHARCTEVLVWETTDMREYRDAVDTLHRHEFFSQPCFEILDVIPSVPDGWREYEWECGTTTALAA